MKKKALVLFVLSMVSLLFMKLLFTQSAQRGYSASNSQLSHAMHRDGSKKERNYLPTKSKNRPRKFSMDELVSMAKEARKEGEVEEARTILNAALKREPENEEAAKELMLSHIEIVNLEGFSNYGSAIETIQTDELGEPLTVIITESRIEMPVFSTRRVSEE